MLGKVVAGAMALGGLHVGMNLFKNIGVSIHQEHHPPTVVERAENVELLPPSEAVIYEPEENIPPEAPPSEAVLGRSSFTCKDIVEHVKFVGTQALEALDIAGHAYVFAYFVEKAAKFKEYEPADACLVALSLAGSAALLCKKVFSEVPVASVPLSTFLKVKQALLSRIRVLQTRNEELVYDLEETTADAQEAIQALERKEEAAVLARTKPPQ